MSCLSREEYISDLIGQYEEAKEFIRLALAERKKWEEQGKDYNPHKAPTKVRDLCVISYDNVKKAIAPSLCHNVEIVQQGIAYRICKALDAPGNVPMVEWVEEYISKSKATC